MKWKIQYKNSEGSKRFTTIEANTKLEAMKLFNEINRNRGFDIRNVYEENEEIVETVMEDKKSMPLKDYLVLKQVNKEKLQQKSNMLEEVNNILFEQLKKTRNIDTTDKENASAEIIKSNSMANTSKVLIQSIGMQMMIDKQKGL